MANTFFLCDDGSLGVGVVSLGASFFGQQPFLCGERFFVEQILVCRVVVVGIAQQHKRDFDVQGVCKVL